MKTAYKFESKHLGQAFMKELEGMGYLKMDECHADDKIHTYFNEKGYDDGQAWFSGVKQSCEKTFQLETDWNEALSHARRQLEPEFKVGNWMKVITHNYTWLIHITKIENGFYKGFGFKDGVWYDFEPEARIFKWYDDYTYINPAPEEIKYALVKECERRGLDKGKFKPVIDSIINYGGVKYRYLPDEDILYLNGRSVYSQGKWAEKIEDKFFDWDVEIGTEMITIGCRTDRLSYWEQLKSDLEAVSEKTVQEVINELNKIL